MREPTSIDHDAGATTDPHPCVVSVYEGGPYLVRGGFELRDAQGRRLGLRRRTIALCGCGRTRTAPFCDGTHKIGSLSGPPAAA
jgi:CDGSH-type Zn-finger protein